MAFFSEVFHVRQVRYLYVSVRRNRTFRPNIVIDELSHFWKEKFPDILIKPNGISNEIWESVRNDVIESTKQKNEIVDALIFEVFKKENCPDAGINYYKFLETNNYHRSITIVANYLTLYQLKEELTDADKVQIWNLCNEVIKQHKLLPNFLVEPIVKCFCQIDKWEEAIEVIKEFEKHDTMNSWAIYDTLIQYFLKTDKPELAWEYLVISAEKGVFHHTDTYSMYLKYCLKEKNAFNERIEKLFLFWRKYGVKPNQSTINECIAVCTEVGWFAQVAKISKLKCNVCRETLLEPQLPQEVFDCLRDVIIKKVIVDNACTVSTPEEWRAFVKFIDLHKPYDFVVDGLNVLNVLRRHIIETKAFAFLQCLKHEGKKVLVIGRKHMKSKKHILQLQAFADFFFVNDSSMDDAFILYAAFVSKYDTNIISKDLMRQHKYNFHDLKLDVLFKKWQMRHQFFVDITNPTKLKRLGLLYPIDGCAIKTKNCWHIPYHDTLTRHLNKRHTCNTNWACFNMRP